MAKRNEVVLQEILEALGIKPGYLRITPEAKAILHAYGQQRFEEGKKEGAKRA